MCGSGEQKKTARENAPTRPPPKTRTAFCGRGPQARKDAGRLSKPHVSLESRLGQPIVYGFTSSVRGSIDPFQTPANPEQPLLVFSLLGLPSQQSLHACFFLLPALGGACPYIAIYDRVICPEAPGVMP